MNLLNPTSSSALQASLERLRRTPLDPSISRRRLEKPTARLKSSLPLYIPLFQNLLPSSIHSIIRSSTCLIFNFIPALGALPVWFRFTRFLTSSSSFVPAVLASCQFLSTCCAGTVPYARFLALVCVERLASKLFTWRCLLDCFCWHLNVD